MDKNKRWNWVSKGDNQETRPGETNDDKIYVPALLWTAGCYFDTSSPYCAIESFVVIVKNGNERDKMCSQQISVKILQNSLKQDYFTAEEVSLILKIEAVWKKTWKSYPSI